MSTFIGVALVLAAAAWAAFSLWYMIRARWWKSAYGINTLAVSTVLAIAFTRLAMLTCWPQIRADLEWTGLSVYVLIAALGIHRFFLLEKAQAEGERTPAPETVPPVPPSQ